MKSILLPLNIVLTIAVIVLFYLHFSSGTKQEVPKPVPAVALSEIPGKNVFVNVDSLLHNYDYYKQLKKDFDNKSSRFENEMQRRMGALENEYGALQDKARAGMMTELQMAEAEQKMMKKQQDLMAYKEEQESALLRENQKLNDELHTKITDYLRFLNNQNNFQYVFGFTREGGILFANDSLDITQHVLDGLNEEFRTKK